MGRALGRALGPLAPVREAVLVGMCTVAVQALYGGEGPSDGTPEEGTQPTLGRKGGRREERNTSGGCWQKGRVLMPF